MEKSSESKGRFCPFTQSECDNGSFYIDTTIISSYSYPCKLWDTTKNDCVLNNLIRDDNQIKKVVD